MRTRIIIGIRGLGAILYVQGCWIVIKMLNESTGSQLALESPSSSHSRWPTELHTIAISVARSGLCHVYLSCGMMSYCSPSTFPRLIAFLIAVVPTIFLCIFFILTLLQNNSHNYRAPAILVPWRPRWVEGHQGQWCPRDPPRPGVRAMWIEERQRRWCHCNPVVHQWG
jgi:hypothetical protein